MKQELGYVYRVYKKDNQKSYIGITMNIIERIGKHRRSNVKNMVIHHAIRKYGWNAFDWEILERCIKENLMYRERIYIAMFDTYKGFGYNQTNGGEHILFGENNPLFGRTGKDHHRYGIPHTDEVKRKISIANTGNKHSDETKRKMSESRTGEKNNFYGKSHTLETRRKLSKALSGENNPNYGKTLSIETKKKISKSLKESWKRRRNN